MMILWRKIFGTAEQSNRPAAGAVFSLILVLMSSCVQPSHEAATASAPIAANTVAQPPTVVTPSGERPYVQFGFDTRLLKPGHKIDDVLAETLAAKGNITSKFTLSNSESLDAGMKWVGEPFKEIGNYGSGVFRSSDGLRQFRIDKNSLAGAHAPGVVHVHYETYAVGANHFSANNHVRIEEK